MTPAAALARARATAAQADLAFEQGDLRTAQALRGAQGLWERLARPGIAWSLEPARRQLTGLKRELAVANGPFTTPKPPKAPSPATAELTRRIVDSVKHLERLEAVTIEF